MKNQLSLFAFTVMVEQMRTAQQILSSEVYKEANKDIREALEESLIIKQAKRITRDLELVVDQAIKENYASNVVENGSFVTSEYIRVNCCKCEELLTLDGDNYACFNDMDEAKSSVEMNDWKLEGNQATCDECLEKEKEVQS